MSSIDKELANLARFKKAVNLIETYLEQCVQEDYLVEETTTNSFKVFKENVKRSNCYTITEEGLDDSIFKDRKTHIKYRTWHDAIHFNNEFTFNLAGELNTVEKQKADILTFYYGLCIDKLVKIDKELVADCTLVLYIDVVGQYFEYLRKDFIESQADYVYKCFKKDIKH